MIYSQIKQTMLILNQNNKYNSLLGSLDKNTFSQ